MHIRTQKMGERKGGRKGGEGGMEGGRGRERREREPHKPLLKLHKSGISFYGSFMVTTATRDDSFLEFMLKKHITLVTKARELEQKKKVPV